MFMSKSFFEPDTSRDIKLTFADNRNHCIWDDKTHRRKHWWLHVAQGRHEKRGALPSKCMRGSRLRLWQIDAAAACTSTRSKKAALLVSA